MAETFSTSFGYTDSVTTPKNIAVPDLSWAADYAVMKNSDREVVLTNTTSPVDQPETIRFGYQTIANVYTNSGIDPSYMAVTRRGVSIVAQVNDILRVTPTGADCCGSSYDLPLSAHVVLRVPLNQFVTADMANTLVKRAVATMYNTGSVNSDRISALLRGALVPSQM